VNILILEDDDAQAELVAQWVANAGHECTRASCCKDFLNEFPRMLPQLVILDWELPDGTGLEGLSTLRGRMHSEVPVLFTTQRDTEQDIVSALQAGADDYLIKPLREAEFSARLTALSRRAGINENTDTLLIEAPYELDISKQSVKLHGETLKLTQKDFEVCRCLFEHLGTALSREFLLKAVWGVSAGLDTRTVDVHVSRVRRALKLGLENGFIVKTIYQYGYRLEKLPPNIGT